MSILLLTCRDRVSYIYVRCDDCRADLLDFLNRHYDDARLATELLNYGDIFKLGTSPEPNFKFWEGKKGKPDSTIYYQDGLTEGSSFCVKRYWGLASDLARIDTTYEFREGAWYKIADERITMALFAQIYNAFKRDDPMGALAAIREGGLHTIDVLKIADFNKHEKAFREWLLDII